ncbi:glycosyltransferase [Desulfofustis limnaeus]|jgi:glycosyltransferase involved in cell wall biosynthesis|uniref:Glycosyl transferase family 1 domain-containing protein n=1 Tax=Desulfofustis limnaeus TaxID=2740163 RepID=A0ABM7WDH4_9BACT|nr:glycosyltransferase [Desulfofustis limnaeus]MDX9894166.1 glycosyltransferase [Desulfofustis sp.]BDD89036.1 hypothetical protein DPPLL_34010 [Desulfofustis limnaeus]
MNISFYLPFVSCHGTANKKVAPTARQAGDAMTIPPPPWFPPSFLVPYAAADLLQLSTQGLDGMALYGFLQEQRHDICIASTYCSRGTYLKPWGFSLLKEQRKVALSRQSTTKSTVWLSCHCSDTAPDLLGPHCRRHLSIPYVVYQPIPPEHGHRFKIGSLAGQWLNRRALQRADLVFIDRKTTEQQLRHALPLQRIQYIKPRLNPDHFSFDLVARRALREYWSVGEQRIVMTTAMLRPGVKTIGVRKVIDSCQRLRQRGLETLLVIAGDGLDRTLLEREAREKLADQVIFIGKIPRHDLYRYYSAADVFAFPGIQESRGLVFLEAQAAGLPVVACADWSAADTVVHEKTGLLAPASQPDRFTGYLERILTNREERITMREAAKNHVRSNHAAEDGYRLVQRAMEKIVARKNQAYS